MGLISRLRHPFGGHGNCYCSSIVKQAYALSKYVDCESFRSYGYMYLDERSANAWASYLSDQLKLSPVKVWLFYSKDPKAMTYYDTDEIAIYLNVRNCENALDALCHEMSHHANAMQRPWHYYLVRKWYSQHHMEGESAAWVCYARYHD